MHGRPPGVQNSAAFGRQFGDSGRGAAAGTQAGGASCRYPATVTFIKPYIIRLSHCDATGQVFYPNYFHIFNALLEDWFYEGLEIPFHSFLMDRGLSLPTVKLESTFLAPTRMGEVVDFWLTVSHLGRSSLRFTMGVTKDGDDRVRMHRIAVCMSQKTGKSTPIPPDLREKITEFMRG